MFAAHSTYKYITIQHIKIKAAITFFQTVALPTITYRMPVSEILCKLRKQFQNLKCDSCSKLIKYKIEHFEILYSP